MPKAILFDLGDTVLKENAYDLEHGFNTISKYLSSSVTLGNLNKATKESQINNSEFKLLQWLRENLSKDYSSTNAKEVELELWKKVSLLYPLKASN